MRGVERIKTWAMDHNIVKEMPVSTSGGPYVTPQDHPYLKGQKYPVQGI